MYYIKLTGGFRLNKTFELPDARFILHAAAAWAAAAVVLALLAALFSQLGDSLAVILALRAGENTDAGSTQS